MNKIKPTTPITDRITDKEIIAGATQATPINMKTIPIRPHELFDFCKIKYPRNKRIIPGNKSDNVDSKFIGFPIISSE